MDERQIIGSLLKGGTLLFGKRIELAWPDGLPDGMTADDLRRIGEQMSPDDRWVITVSTPEMTTVRTRP